MHRAIRGSARCLATAAVLAATCSASAQAATLPVHGDRCGAVTDSRRLGADSTKAGVITLGFFNAQGRRAVFFECVGHRLRRLGARVNPPGVTSPTMFYDAVTWSCHRLTRRFEASAILPDGSLASGTYTVRTPSCEHRFELHVPRRVAAGSRARIQIVDRWGIGASSPRLCVTPPRMRRSCRVVRFAPAVDIASRRLRVRRPGRWRVELRVGAFRQGASLTVGGGKLAREKALPLVLATGDSTMMSVDSFLDSELANDYTVRSDVRLGAGISRGAYWPELARRQTRGAHQSVTVVSIGAAVDGSPMTPPGGVELACCSQAWIYEYARRTRAIMQTYLRGGRARVFWLTVVAPRRPAAASVATAVNAGFVLAGAGVPGVTVIRTDRVFSPNGYQETIRSGGREVDVREPDGVHLNVSGTAIVAKIVARAIRAGR